MSEPFHVTVIERRLTDDDLETIRRKALHSYKAKRAAEVRLLLGEICLLRAELSDARRDLRLVERKEHQ